jgi:hypothetical protein
MNLIILKTGLYYGLRQRFNQKTVRKCGSVAVPKFLTAALQHRSTAALENRSTKKQRKKT